MLHSLVTLLAGKVQNQTTANYMQWQKCHCSGKKELQYFLGILNYLSKFSADTAEVFVPLGRLTSTKTEWTWNRSAQELNGKAKFIIKKDKGMKFYDTTNPLKLETNVSGVGLGVILTWIGEGINCMWTKTPDNEILRHIAFARRTLSS